MSFLAWLHYRQVAFYTVESHDYVTGRIDRLHWEGCGCLEKGLGIRRDSDLTGESVPVSGYSAAGECRTWSGFRSQSRRAVVSLSGFPSLVW